MIAGEEEAGAATVAFLLSLRAKGIRDTDILRAMEAISRQAFAPAQCGDLSRADVSLPIACGQTMLAPSAIAQLLSQLKLRKEHRVLEIGTGSGYVTTLLAKLSGTVVSVERYRTLAIAAAERLNALGVANARVLHGDGLEPDTALGCFDRILLTGAVRTLPTGLLAMLNPRGRLVGVVTLGDLPRLISVERTESGAYQEELHTMLRLPPLVPGLARAL